MTVERAVIRQDLVISCQDAAEGSIYVVKDPASGRFFRFGNTEHYIISQLDGITTLEAIRQQTEEKFGSSLRPDTLLRFVENLGRWGLLDSPRTESGYRQGGAKRVRGGALYLRLKAFDPDDLFERLSRLMGFCFTPYFLVASAFIILAALTITIANWSAIQHDIRRLYRVDLLVAAWLTVLTVMAVHEFAHGVTCKHFGGEVHEIGLLLIYFQPAFYCNVSDTWLLREKSHRLWVTFAGAYLEIFVWALATLAWRLLEPGTWAYWLAMVVMATSGIKTLFNLNPLIKLDGYYLLSDYLEVPNLRNRSLSYLRTLTTRLLFARGVKPGSPPTGRQRRIYIVYGLLACGYSFWLLSVILLSFGSYLVSRFQGSGLLLFAGLLMVVFQNPIARIMPASVKERGRWLKQASRNRWAVTAALLLIIVGAAYFGRMELKLSCEFKILPAINAQIRAEIEGIIDGIYVNEGDVVGRGDPTARLSDRDVRADLQMTEAIIAEKKAKLRMLEAGARQEEIELAREAVETARTRKEFARNRYDEATRIRAEGLSRAKATLARAKERLTYANVYLQNSRSLFDQGVLSRQDMDRAREEAAVKQKELEQANAEMNMILADDLTELKRMVAVADKEVEEMQGRLKVLLAGSRPEELEATRAEIAGHQAQHRRLEEQMRFVTVLSPISGVITTPKPKERTGQLVKRGDLIMTVQDVQTVIAEISGPEQEIADVKVGQRVILKARAYARDSFEGTVTSIAPIATKEEQERTVLVYSRIENASLLLKPDMTGRAKIYCGKRRIIDLATRRITRYIRVEFWSWW